MENEMYQCILDCHKEKQVDLNAVLDSLEDLLVNRKVLENKSGKAYFTWFEQWRDSGDIAAFIEAGSIRDKSTFAKLTKFHYTCSYDCRLDSAIIDSLKNAINAEFKLFRVFDSLARTNRFESLVAGIITDILTPEDFNNPFYRAYALMMITDQIIYSEENGLRVRLPPVKKVQTRPNDPEMVLKVFVNSKDQLLVEDSLVPIEELTGISKAHILKYEDNAVIRLQNDRSTAYQRYLQVYNEIKRAYNEIKEEYAQQHFGTSYGSLSAENKTAVNEKFPIMISETEPVE